MVNEERDNIEELDEKVYRNSLLYDFKGKTKDTDFSKYISSIDMMNDIRDGNTSLTIAVLNQNNLANDKPQINMENPSHKSKENKSVIKNIAKLYKLRQAVINFYFNYTKIITEAKYRAKQEGTGLKILTPKQMLQRLPIALAQIKAGNNSKSLLNKIRQIVYSLYQSKEITKKVYNNIIKSIKV